MVMQRIWAGIAAAWAVIAVFTVLALHQAPVGQTVNGTTTAAHATTSSSTVATGTASQSSTQSVAAVTRTS